MEGHELIRRIIRLYFGKHFSHYGRFLFGRWLRAEEDKEEKADVLQELWEESPNIATEATTADWMILSQRLQYRPLESNVRPLSRRWQTYAAVIAFLLFTTGTTYWFTRTQTPRVVEMAELFVPYGESKQLLLPDGSEVWVDAGSLLIYPTDFSAADTRTVYLNGEASFKVYKNAEKPFIVKTTHLDVQALGTVFTVESYPDGFYTTATLEEGSIQIDTKGKEHLTSILKPNDQLVYSHKDHTIHIHQVDAALYGMERNGYLIFENVSFNQLMASLERRFNIVIHYNSQKYAGDYYNVKFAPKETLTDVLAILKQLVGLNYQVKGNVVIIN